MAASTCLTNTKSALKKTYMFENRLCHDTRGLKRVILTTNLHKVTLFNQIFKCNYFYSCSYQDQSSFIVIVQENTTKSKLLEQTEEKRAKLTLTILSVLWRFKLH